MRVNLTCTDWQQEVIEAYLGKGIRFISVMAGRRAGKTYSFLACVSLSSLKKRGYKTWYVAPNYGQAKEQYENLVALPSLRNFIAKTRLQPYPMIFFKNGSTIGFRSFDRPRALVGSGLDAVWVDEIQDINGKEFFPVIRPLISDRRGKLIISGQHRGKESWYYKALFRHGLPGGDASHRSWQISSYRGLVYQTSEGIEELETARSQVPKAVFNQEYLCIPSANQAAVFDPDDLERSKRGVVNPPDSYLSVVLGLDLGRVVDPSAMCGIDANEKMVVFAAKRPLKEKHEIGAKEASKIAKRFGDCEIVVDTTGGATGGQAGKNDAFVQFYSKECPTMRAFTITRDNKSRLITNLCLAIEQNLLAIPEEFEDLHKELSMYEYKVIGGGSVIYQGPGGHDDDMVIALALSWEGVQRGWYSSQSSSMRSIVGSIGG